MLTRPAAPCLGSFDANGVSTQQNFATSADGTKIPYFLIMPKDAPLDGSTPTLLYGCTPVEIEPTAALSRVRCSHAVGSIPIWADAYPMLQVTGFPAIHEDDVGHEDPTRSYSRLLLLG